MCFHCEVSLFGFNVNPGLFTSPAFLSGLIDTFHNVLTQSFGLYTFAGRRVRTFNYELWRPLNGDSSVWSGVWFRENVFSLPFFLKVPVVKATWEKDAGFLEFYSDVTDTSIPTISLGVPNTERGELIRSSDPARIIVEQICWKDQVMKMAWGARRGAKGCM